jgi:nucleoside-diphosphate-sugar epimerase
MLEHLETNRSLPTRTVVLGSGGFVGSAVVGRLEREGAPVLALTSKDLDLLSSDVAERLSRILQPHDALVFVSALVPCKDATSLMKNIQMVEAAIPALEAVAIDHVVYISSDAVYADEPRPITEAFSASPSSLHGMMHRARELLLTASVKSPLAILRPSLIYGLADPHNGYGPNRFRRTALEDRMITLFGGGEEQRDHVFIDDVAEIVLRILACRSRGVLNVATGRSVSFREIADQIAGQTGHAIEIRCLPRGNPITHRHFDITAALKSFPTFHYTPVEEGLARIHEQVAAGPT